MMKFPLIRLLIIVILISAGSLKAQNPSEQAVYSIIVNYKSKDGNRAAYARAYGQQIKYFHGSYTAKGNKECLVVYPIQQGKDFYFYAVLMFQEKDDNWRDGCWIEPLLMQLQVKDLNNDGLLEILAQTRTFTNGRQDGTYRVISLNGQTAKNWYQNQTYTGTGFANAKQLPAGSVVNRDIKVEFTDDNKDGIYLLKETVKLGKLSGFDANGKAITDNSQEINYYELGKKGYQKTPFAP